MATVQSAPTTQVQAPAVEEKRIKLTPRRAQILWGYFFLIPWILGFFLFLLGPMIASLYLSMTDYNIQRPGETDFIGTENYEKIFSLQVIRDSGDEVNFKPGYTEAFRIGSFHFGSRDHEVWKAIQVTLTFAIISLPVNLGLALFFALLTNTKVPGVRLFRTIYYLPSVIPAVVSATVFQQFLRGQDGWLNVYLLSPLGLGKPEWLQEPSLAIPALTIIGTWGIGTTMLMFLAGLQNVPTELYEAAEVDGANYWSRFRNVTLPMISPVILYNLVIGLIGTFQYFVVAYVLTPRGAGGNDLAMYFYNLHLYREAYVFFDMGYASALAWILFIVVLIVTILVFRSSSRWVFYAGGK
ncbi:MAG: ABC transporter [Chloroflexota bacterium]|nr:sugar ABC transporter permease [Chloroflexota bacterium]NOG65508.1 sugar ABC transporter permease [Chloroflexota bacterium]GIK65340.1 MAG: ABC transporter [Chloroflexota bacterium]